MTNFIDSFKDQMSGMLLDKVSDIMGMNNTQSTNAISKFLPAILGGLISKGSTPSSADSLIDLFKNKNLGDSKISDLTSMLSDEKKSTNWLDLGSELLGNLFGSKQSSILDMLLGATGVKKESGSWLLKFLAPLVMNKLAGMVFKNKWNGSQLSNFLTGEKSNVLGALPEIGSLLGFADTSGNKSSKTTESKGSGLGWLKWFIPLLLLLLAIWYFTRNGCGNKETEMVEEDTTMVDSTEVETTETTMSDEATQVATIDFSTLTLGNDGSILDGNGTVVFPNGSFGMDAAGNVVNAAGKILIPVGSLPATLNDKLKAYLGKYYNTKMYLDANGNLVDETGKIILKKGEFVEKDGFYYDKKGNKLGRIWEKIIEAISNAAEKTIDGMKKLFSNMFTKKEGVQSTYTLTNIVFNPENHRITNYSKAEVEGLAAALKADPNSKITVQAYTMDGKNAKENKELSKTRAMVVHDMLVTLGVPEKQISAEGLGDGVNKVLVKVN